MTDRDISQAPAATPDVEEAGASEAKLAWNRPQIGQLDVGKGTYNAGPTFLDTGSFAAVSS